jgi:hypothetical protein
MGWNFGGAIIDFDFHSVVDPLLEPERRQYLDGSETPEEVRSKAQIDAGIVALEALDLSAAPADAPISFADATSRDFDGYAVGMVDRKTLILGGWLGLDQDSPKLKSAYERVSRERGAVFAFWFNDASSTYCFSMFRDGARVRFRSSGPGMHDDEGARVPGEPVEGARGHDDQMAVLAAVTGRLFFDLSELHLERFCAC